MQLSPSHAFWKQLHKVQKRSSSARIPYPHKNGCYPLANFSPYRRYTNAAFMERSLKWRQNGWRDTTGNTVSNKSLIEYILTLLETRQQSGQPVRIEYVRGHSGGHDNRSDVSARFPRYNPRRDRHWQVWRGRPTERWRARGTPIPPT